jgi:hypothetical protein
MGWVSGGLALVCLGLAVLHLLRVALRRRDSAIDPAVEFSHTAMALGMAAMFSPVGDPVPQPAWTIVFVAAAAWFVVRRLRGPDQESLHHIVGSTAMLFMLVAGHGPHGGPDSLGLLSVVAILLTGYFGWHALRCAERCRRSEDAEVVEAGGALALQVRSLRAPQLAAMAHLVMAVAMAGMLLGMV